MWTHPFALLAFCACSTAAAYAPGARAQAQRAALRALLTDSEAAAGEHAGAGEPIGVWDRVGGRLYATAMGVRALIDP